MNNILLNNMMAHADESQVEGLMRFFKTAPGHYGEGDRLRAEAVSVADHHKIPSVEVRITNQEGQQICHVTGMGYRKNDPLPTIQ